VLILNEQQMSLVARIASDAGRVRCQECGESKALKSDGRAVRHQGDVRFWLTCKNGHRTDMTLSAEDARNLRLPVPQFRKPSPRPPGTAPRA